MGAGLAQAQAPGRPEPATAAASATAPAPDPSALARHPQWRRLVHAGPDGRSEIHSREFFLAPQGDADPEAELRATVQALSAPPGADADAHARCRFPARAVWLEQQGLLPPAAAPHLACPRLGRWARLEQLRSVSLLLVSGYFANPASTFGHSLLRLNTEDGSASEGLIDLGVNFGALVPEGEPIAVYVAKGLTGGYEAGFSDKSYYTHDLTYSRTEFRDMWNHELELDAHEQRMLVYHLWEIAAKKFTYYFLRENCAYRMAELLAVARPDDGLLARSSAWYAPVELFHRLRTAQAHGGRPWVRAVQFIPSAERVLRHELQALDAEQARVVQAWIEQGEAAAQPLLRALPPARQMAVLDTLLSYHAYRMTAEEPNVSPATRRDKDAVLRARLRLPPSPAERERPPVLPSPAEGTAPMLLAAGAGHDERRGRFTRLQWAPFGYELAGHGGLEDGELVVLDTAVDVPRHGSARLDRLDVIRVRKLHTARTLVPGESSLSWQVQLGARRERAEGDSRLRVGGRFGIGQALRWSEAVTAYAMVDAVALGNPLSAGVEPQLGLVLQAQSWKAWLMAGTRYETASRHWTPQAEARVSRRLGPDWSGRIELGRARWMLTLARHW